MPYTFIALFIAAVVGACTLAATTAQADSESAPVAQTLAPTGAAVSGVVLHGTVDAGSQTTKYWFEFGPTTAYGSSTPSATTDKSQPVPVVSVVSGLLEGTTYHARLVARNDDGLSRGADMTFATLGPIPTPNAPSPLAAGGEDSGSDSDGDSDSGSAPVLAPPAPPKLGQRVGVAAQAGSVLVRLPGSTRTVALTDAASIPIGSIVDTRKGTVTLRSQVAGVGTQAGTFHGGLFEVRQPAGARGMTELVLRGPMPTCSAGGARAAAAATRRPPRGLWVATTTGASARAAATASPPSAARPGTSRIAATGR